MMAPLQERTIRSFVTRLGRITPAQQLALQTLWPRFGVDQANATLDWKALFGREAPRIVEIGFGSGEATAKIAEENPDTDYLGVEVHTPGIGHLLRLIEKNSLNNLRLIQGDIIDVLRFQLAPSSIDGFHIYFPDPWPKKRHHKRRLLQKAFVADLTQRLKPGGYLHCATDWEQYAAEMLEVLSQEPTLNNNTDGFSARPSWRPLTKFEQRGLRLGHPVRDLFFHRTPV